jgi:hypothetical protein
MSEYPHYRVMLDLGQLSSPDAARLKAAVLERCANESGAGPAVVVDIMAAEYTWSSVAGCPVCGSLVCAGRQAHRAAAPEQEPGTSYRDDLDRDGPSTEVDLRRLAQAGLVQIQPPPGSDDQ